MSSQYSIENMFSLKGKVALITGGSRGLGRMIAQAYVENGVRVYITSRTVTECEGTAEELSQFGECIGIPADIATEAGRQALIDSIKSKESRLDILINNAGKAGGINSPEEFGDYSESLYDDIMAINLKAPFRLTQGLSELLQAGATQADPARVINISSVLGLRPPHGMKTGVSSGAYGPSKAAVISMSKEFGSLLGKKHITFNVIAPGFFATEMTSLDGEFDPTFKKHLEDTLPLSRLGEAMDMAGAAVFLASPASAFVTGEVISVDGGYGLI